MNILKYHQQTKERGTVLNNPQQFNTIAKPNRETISKLLSALSDPDDGQRFIHIAGTNGKGSVCAYLQSILSDAGYKTGKFTSPHMLCERERITVDGQMIPQTDFDRIMETIHFTEQLIFDENSMPTRFEEWFACALVWFKECNCDYSVLETGLGGRQDATNVIKSPIMTVITQIALDHTELLGGTLEKIAFEKAGIIKPAPNGKGITVLLNQNKAAFDVLEKCAKKANNRIFTVDPPKSSGICDNLLEFCCKDTVFKSRMIGKYQAENAAVAIECASVLGIDKEHIINGILNAKNPGRFEVLSENPPIIFDGAHNPNGIKALTDTVKSYYRGKKLNLIMAFMKEKDIDGSLNILCDELTGFEKKFFAVEVAGNKRSMPSDDVCRKMTEKGFCAINCKTVKNALASAESSDSLTVICGSLYLYSEYFNQ